MSLPELGEDNPVHMHRAHRVSGLVAGPYHTPSLPPSVYAIHHDFSSLVCATLRGPSLLVWLKPD